VSKRRGGCKKEAAVNTVNCRTSCVLQNNSAAVTESVTVEAKSCFDGNRKLAGKLRTTCLC
jgi:hypothetical protein